MFSFDGVGIPVVLGNSYASPLIQNVIVPSMWAAAALAARGSGVGQSFRIQEPVLDATGHRGRASLLLETTSVLRARFAAFAGEPETTPTDLWSAKVFALIFLLAGPTGEISRHPRTSYPIPDRAREILIDRIFDENQPNITGLDGNSYCTSIGSGITRDILALLPPRFYQEHQPKLPSKG